MRKQKSSLVLTLLSFLPFSAQSETLRLCSTADWPPYEFTDPATKKVKGNSVDIIHKIAEKLSMEVEITSLPWERCLQMNERGEMDGVFSVSKKPEREQYLIYPEKNIQYVSYNFATLKGKNVIWNEKKDVSLIPQPIGSPQGFSVTQSLKSEKNVQIDDSAPSDEINITKLINGRLGSIVVGPEALSTLLKEHQLEDKIVKLDPPYVDAKKYYVAISKKYKGEESKATELCKKIDQAIEGILPK